MRNAILQLYPSWLMRWRKRAAKILKSLGTCVPNVYTCEALDLILGKS